MSGYNAATSWQRGSIGTHALNVVARQWALDPMINNFRRLVILHFVLGLISIASYCMRPGSFAAHGHLAGRMIALTALIKVFLAWIPYFVSGYYACDVLPRRDPNATLAFIAIAMVIGGAAACVNLLAPRGSAAPLLAFAVVTVLLLASARICAAIWRDEEPEWDGPF
jgi:hypothetical protein